ncbi:MAG: hypothetical protein CMO80_10920 [Verrucomicrobiales bacterium]|nr:hypothetical protein [Verrucomicrobiales bacterium]|tara:strand:+ start:287 stop:484 length:198 start_codon:yes stop_codon:yes gene_type:complete
MLDGTKATGCVMNRSGDAMRLNTNVFNPDETILATFSLETIPGAQCSASSGVPIVMGSRRRTKNE